MEDGFDHELCGSPDCECGAESGPLWIGKEGLASNPQRVVLLWKAHLDHLARTVSRASPKWVRGPRLPGPARTSPPEVGAIQRLAKARSLAKTVAAI